MLSDKARSVIQNPEHIVYLSSVSSFEISVKTSIGKLELHDSPSSLVLEWRRQYVFEELPLNEKSALTLSKLPLKHKDPFDRLLICQAITEGLGLVTPDEQISQYAVNVVW